MSADNLPTEEQRVALCDLMHNAFVELRYLEGEQAHDLAYAFHNLPKEIYGWGGWSPDGFRARLAHYQSKHSHSPGFNYVLAFNAIFPAKT
jgi:hypothetical protein